ncbi:hypothetical protein Q8A73_009030 [Channa argus]|nr:hypothetical protein Q8A73_009030 [Channa argus]
MLGGGRAPGGAQHWETERRAKWSWRVCQGSATYCTTTPPPSKYPHKCLLSLRKPQTSANSQPKVTKGTEGAGEQRRTDRRGNLCFSSKSSAAHTDSLIITWWQQLCEERWENWGLASCRSRSLCPTGRCCGQH